MYDEWLVSRLSKNAWALLGALLLLRQIESRLSTTELMLRSSLSKNNFWKAKTELIAKGMIEMVDYPGQPSLIILKGIHDGADNPFTVGEDTKLASGEVPRIERQVRNTDARDNVIIQAFASAFPEEHKKYPLNEGYAAKMLTAAGYSVGIVLNAIEKAVERKPTHPKAYILSICKAQPDNKDDVPAPPPKALVELTQRAREYAVTERQRDIGDRRSRRANRESRESQQAT